MSNNKIGAQKAWFDDDNLWVLLTDGRKLGVPLSYFPVLQKATPEQRDDFKIGDVGYCLHWNEIDEDISVPGLLRADMAKPVYMPQKFKINETWIALKINQEPMETEDGSCNLYGLVDAGSCYLFGPCPVLASNELGESEVEALFQKAYSEKNTWAKKLLLTGDSAELLLFKQAAEKHGLIIESISLEEIEPIVGELRDHFMEMFSDM